MKTREKLSREKHRVRFGDKGFSEWMHLITERMMKELCMVKSLYRSVKYLLRMMMLSIWILCPVLQEVLAETSNFDLGAKLYTKWLLIFWMQRN